MRIFLDEMLARKMISSYEILENQAGERCRRLGKYLVLIVFNDDNQFGLPFAEIRAAGIHRGAHGQMIESVDTFATEVLKGA